MATVENIGHSVLGFVPWIMRMRFRQLTRFLIRTTGGAAGGVTRILKQLFIHQPVKNPANSIGIYLRQTSSRSSSHSIASALKPSSLTI
jgi:hypothetical protein